MKKQTIIITDENGLHARPASQISRIASDQSGKISLLYQDKEINLKSILAVMSLAIPQDAEVTIAVEGDEEEATLDKIIKAFDDQGIKTKRA